ncbi:odorant receptor Or2-like [Anthonomus grandis grandis]|uniref:odorant receptor Or2-like n=1 Tax=Anthonomus grandis grandis TaxID=2921223 RepID=UPI0021661BE1|nr:odorant receptor Or2-like [Anthonomus grandis grandis]
MTWHLLKIIMVCAGCWRLQLTNNKIINFFYILYSIFVQASLLLFFIGLVINIPVLLKQKDFEKVSESIGYSIIDSVLLVKIYICQTQNVQNLIEQYQINQRLMYRDDPKEVHKVSEADVTVINKLIKILTVATACTCLSLYISTYLKYLEYKRSNSTGEKPLILPIWYPFNTNKYYKTAFFVGVLFCIVGGGCYLVIQALFLTLVTHAIIQLKAIQILGRGLTKFSKKNYVNHQFNDEQVNRATLRNLCLKHQSIISFVDKFNLAMRNILLIEFILNSVNIAAFIIRLLIMQNSFWMKIFLITICITQIFQLFVLAWHANELQIQSIMISDALFESEWYETSKSVKSTIVFMMARSRKPLRLFVGPFFPMTINTAIATMKAAYSYVTLMVAMTDNGGS